MNSIDLRIIFTLQVYTFLFLFTLTALLRLLDAISQEKRIIVGVWNETIGPDKLRKLMADVEVFMMVAAKLLLLLLGAISQTILTKIFLHFLI